MVSRNTVNEIKSVGGVKKADIAQERETKGGGGGHEIGHWVKALRQAKE